MNKQLSQKYKKDVFESQSQSTYAEKLKVNVNTVNAEFKRRKFMKDLTDNPRLLEYFSNDRLEKILQWYLHENSNKREKLK